MANVRLVPVNLVSPCPVDMAWFCSGHSPPLSHIGQSSGWLISSSSIIAALGLLGDRRRQLGVHHHAVGAGRGARRRRLGLALDLDQALPAGADRVEQRVVAEPRDLDAELLGGPDHQRPLGHGDLEPVDGDRHAVDRAGDLAAVAGARRGCTVIRRTPSRRASTRPGRTGSRRAWKCSMYSSRKYLIDDMTGLIAPSPSAQNARPSDVVADVEQLVQVGLAALAALQLVEQLDEPVACPRGTACTCRRTRAGRTRSSAASRGPRRWSRRRSAAPGCRASTRRRPTDS